MKQKHCFLSFARNDSQLVSQEIIPILKQLDVTFQSDEESLVAGESYQALVTRQMASSDFIISIGYRRSKFHEIELDIAIAIPRPIIVVTDHDDERVSELENCSGVRFNKANKAIFKMNLKSLIDKML